MFVRILSRDTSIASPSYVTGELLSQRMLFVTCMTIFVIIITCGLTLLVGEQTINILNNMVSHIPTLSSPPLFRLFVCSRPRMKKSIDQDIGG